MTVLGYLSTLLHVFLVFLVGSVAAFSTKKLTLSIILALVLLVFYQSIVFDGCVMSKFDTLPFTTKTPTSIVRSSLTISENELRNATLEKVLIGITAGFLAFKLAVILYFEFSTGQPFTKIRIPF